LNEGYAALQAAYETDQKKWQDEQVARKQAYRDEVVKAKAAGQPVPPPPANEAKISPPAMPDGGQNGPTNLYNAMIAPLIPYGIKGALWYQGESNGNMPFEYGKLLTRMITDWREKWGEGDFPFLIVQLPNTGANKEWDNGAFFGEAQAKALSLPNAGWRSQSISAVRTFIRRTSLTLDCASRWSPGTWPTGKRSSIPAPPINP